MYRVDYIEGRWQILDVSGRAVFTGNRQQVEDWLDYQENVQRWKSSTGPWPIGGNLESPFPVDFQIDDEVRAMGRCD
jgi:hypothetical protein